MKITSISYFYLQLTRPMQLYKSLIQKFNRNNDKITVKFVWKLIQEMHKVRRKNLVRNR